MCHMYHRFREPQACMFISAGASGDVLKVQQSVAAARKVFRILRPIESLTPLICDGLKLGQGPAHLEIAKKLRCQLGSP